MRGNSGAHGLPFPLLLLLPQLSPWRHPIWGLGFWRGCAGRRGRRRSDHIAALLPRLYGALDVQRRPSHLFAKFQLAYMFWILGYNRNEGHQLLQSKRPSFPKLEAIKLATADILTGLSKNCITLKWKNGSCSSVEISGLDIGWGQEGRYEYKYVVDGNWLCNEHEMKTKPNADGHVNNYIQTTRALKSKR